MQNRTIIDHVTPEVNHGRFPAKRVVGERVEVSAKIFGDSHDYLRAIVEYRKEGSEAWHATELQEEANDLWKGGFLVSEMGFYDYRLIAWVDHLKTWHKGFKKKQADGQEMGVELQIGANFLSEKADALKDHDHHRVTEAIQRLGGHEQEAVEYVLSSEFAGLLHDYPLRRHVTVYDPGLQVKVGRERQRFSSWYELFPRSTSPDTNRSGTFRDTANLLPRIKEFGFDVLYMPPIHPVGYRNRKGRNNAVKAMEGEPGSPWAIGAPEGGHKSILPALGTLEDYQYLMQQCAEHNMEVALDLAFQCAPDHPYIKEHPEWFIWRPDGSIMYAENPPKKYQDIVPINFETEDWEALWQELLEVTLYWCEAGVRIFRVDNPHTKPYRFWEFIIRETNKRYPEVIFLAEAFTRPAIMAELAKRGFQQSYTYFTWRTTPQEMREYLEELSTSELREFMQPNFWPNTPDILAYEMMGANENQFVKRLLLAATLSSSYGVYGPSYELMENRGNTNGKEEYYDSEKYMARHYDWSYRNRITETYRRINAIRKEHAALQQTNNIKFTDVSNPNLLSYVKYSDDRSSIIWTIVSFDQHHVQDGYCAVPKGLLGERGFQVEDLLTGATYWWNADANYVRLDPGYWPAHVLRVRLPEAPDRG